MSKRLFFLATLVAVFAASVFAGQAFADVEYKYEPYPNLQCNGAQYMEWMRASLANQSGSTIYFKRWWKGTDTQGQKYIFDNNYWPLWNNQANDMSFNRRWPDDLYAIGWDVWGSAPIPGVSVINQANYCGY
jgi:hypothetical protein